MYSHLIGKRLDVIGLKKISTAKIVEINFDIGITIVNADDSDDYIRCIHGSVAYKARTGKGYTDNQNLEYEERFQKIVEDAKMGIYEVPDSLAGLGSHPSQENCAFNL